MKSFSIPLKYSCSRCKGDIRESAKECKCKCNKVHPQTFSTSGRGIRRVIIDYNGKQRFQQE